MERKPPSSQPGSFLALLRRLLSAKRPSTSIPGLLSYYGDSFEESLKPADNLVRADVTYLRQDFSLLQKTGTSSELQRFDFVVRKRLLSEAERQEYLLLYGGQAQACRETALNALRRLTGQDAGTTADCWRRALKLASR